MPNELRRSLFAAAFAGAALVGCGGGSGNSPAPAPAPSPTPAPSPPPTAAGSYFLSGHAGSNISGLAVSFADGIVAPDPYDLYVADPAIANPASTMKVVENQATVIDLATVSEWFPDVNFNATAWGTRYRVYAKSNAAGSAHVLYKIDLRKSGSAAIPVPSQLSSGTIEASGSLHALCSLGQILFDDYRAADRSWLVFHATGTVDTDCGSADDNFVGFQMSMGATTAPLNLKQLEPVEVLRDATGLVTGFLALNHPPVDSVGNPISAVPLQRLDTTFAATKTFTQMLTGDGVTAGSAAEFRSLGVSAGNVWLYADTSFIYAVDIANDMSTLVYTTGTGDVVHGRAVFDGTTAYVAINNNITGDYVLAVDLTAKTATAQSGASNGLGGIDLVGTTSANLVYFYDDHTAIKSVTKSNVAAAPVTLFAAGVNQSVDGPLGAVPGAPSVVYLAGDGVFFTLADSSGAGNAKVAHYVKGDGTGATAIGSGTSAVLAPVAAATFKAAGPVVYSGVLVVSGGVSSPAVSFSQATLANYGPTGALAATIGTLPTTPVNPLASLAPVGPPLQAGMPAALEMTGTNNNVQSSADDLAVFTPDMAATLDTLTAFMQ